jgi:D-3-phosphoglycerate dehydrogenase
MKTVLIPHDIAEEGKAYLRERGYTIRMGSGTDKASLLKDVGDVDAILFRNEAYDAQILQAAKCVKVLSRHGVGVDKIDFKKAEELGIWVTNGPYSNSNTVAEMTLAFILTLARKLIAFNKAAHDADFDFRSRVIGMGIEGKTLALLGMGKIGRLVAEKAYYGFSMHVVAYDPYTKDEDFPSYVEKLDSSDEAFVVGDFVSVHIPANETNKKSITIKQFNLMKQSAYLLNLARGELVVEEDLVQALREGMLAGAALDVLDHEPFEKGNPLLSFDNVLLTPHVASHTSECLATMALHAAQGIDEVLSGKKPSWPVNSPVNPRMNITEEENP